MNEPGDALPAGRKGQVGWLVRLRRLRQFPAGRLGVIQAQAGLVPALAASTGRVPGWRVVLVGEPAVLNGQPSQVVIAADDCIEPICPVDKALHHPVPGTGLERYTGGADEDFERVLARLHEHSLLEYCLACQPLDFTLLEVGFARDSQPGQDSLQWSEIFKGQDFHLDALRDSFGNWCLVARTTGDREAVFTERVLPSALPRGQAMQAVLELWEAAFSGKQIPPTLFPGWFYRQHKRDLQSLNPGLPSVWLDGEQLRRSIRWLREAATTSEVIEGPPRDSALSLAMQGGQLHLKTDQVDLGVDVYHGWIDACTVSLRGLLGIAPRAVRGSSIRLVRQQASLSLGGWMLGIAQ